MSFRSVILLKKRDFRFFRIAQTQLYVSDTVERYDSVLQGGLACLITARCTDSKGIYAAVTAYDGIGLA